MIHDERNKIIFSAFPSLKTIKDKFITSNADIILRDLKKDFQAMKTASDKKTVSKKEAVAYFSTNFGFKANKSSYS